MRVYTFQTKELLNAFEDRNYLFVELAQTNCYKHGNHFYDAYLWMGRKLAEKTGLWLTDVFDIPDVARDEDGKGIDEEGERLPLLPFWGWYMVDGECKKPDEEYMFNSDGLDWNLNDKDMMLVSLDIPERYVLLSDANAWYCALEGRPCYEFEDNEDELLAQFQMKVEGLQDMEDDDPRKEKAARKLYKELIGSWDNILRTDGARKLKVVFGMPERRDIQAAFPFIAKEWIVGAERVCDD